MGSIKNRIINCVDWCSSTHPIGWNILIFINSSEIDKYLNDEEYAPIDYSYETYVNDELEYLASPQASEDKRYWLDSLKGYSQDWYSFDNSELGTYEVLLDQIPKFDYSPFVIALALNFLYLAKSKRDNEFRGLNF